MDTNCYTKYFELLSSMPMKLQDLYDSVHDFFPQYSDLDCDTLLEILIGHNAPFCRSRAYLENNSLQYMIDTTMNHISWQDCKMCFVDIESSSPNIENGQIIEIGAVMTQNGEIINTFNSFVYSPYIPEEITHLTGIESSMLQDAPQLHEVFRQFLDFLGDSVFVAHNVAFDYNFVSASLQSLGMPPLLNQRLCTLDLSRRVILSKRHGLAYLNALLGINIAISHRALYDAITSFELYKICSLAFPYAVQTLQNLIDFSKGKILYPYDSNQSM